MKVHRIAIDPNRYAELSYMAAKEQKTPKGLIEDWIRERWNVRDETPIIQLDEKQNCGTSVDIEKPKEEPAPPREKRDHSTNKKLEDSPELRAQVDQLLDSRVGGKPTYAEIGRAVNRSRFCIADYDKRRKA